MTALLLAWAVAATTIAAVLAFALRVMTCQAGGIVAQVLRSARARLDPAGHAPPGAGRRSRRAGRCGRCDLRPRWGVR